MVGTITVQGEECERDWSGWLREQTLTSFRAGWMGQSQTTSSDLCCLTCLFIWVLRGVELGLEKEMSRTLRSLSLGLVEGAPSRTWGNEGAEQEDRDLVWCCGAGGLTQRRQGGALSWRVPGGTAAEAVWPCPVSRRIRPRLGGNPSPPISQRLEGTLLSLTSLPFTS